MATAHLASFRAAPGQRSSSSSSSSRMSPAATVAPFSYTSLIWATLFGFAIFGELPDRWTVVGALVIAASGLYIVHRERVRRRQGPAA